MTRTNITTLLLLISSLPAISAPISPEEALQRAKGDIANKVASAFEKINPLPVYTTFTQKGEPALYLFNNPSKKGFMVVSADDAAIPVLGYSEQWNFSADNLPPQLKWWLNEYAAQIDYARINHTAPHSPRRMISKSGSLEPIAPMVKTKWDQIEPYNNQCPLSGTERTWTGCVATAMAQVMKYWNYPEKGSGQITYSIESLEKKVTLNFALKSFDWQNMIDIYIPGQYTDKEAEAVAYLMKACGYAVKMQYGLDSSGALGMNIGNALTKYFGYDGNLLYTLRQYYSSAQWEEMIYDNLKNIGPVLYGGGSTLGGGHSFVCDGYDGEGMFHFNWGWSGMSDGYFRLSALNPDALGSGGGAGGGYNFNQDAVLGIRPSTGDPVETRQPFLTQEGELAGTLTGANLSFSLVNAGEAMWVNYNPSTLKVKFGAMFYPQTGESDSPIYYYDISDKRLSLEPGYGTSPQVLKASVNLRNLDLPDGTYKVLCGSVPVDSPTGSASTDSVGFSPVKPRYGCPNYLILKKENNAYTVENQLLPPLKITGDVIGQLFYGTLTTVTVTAENPSDVERTVGVAPVFMDEEGPLLLGESICVSIPPHSSVTREWTTPLTQFVQYIDPYLNSKLTFTFFDETNFDFYTDSFTKEVTLRANPGNPVVTLSSPLQVEGGYKSGLNLMIPNPMDIHITGEISLSKGYFNYPVIICLCVPATAGQVEIVNTVSQNVHLSADSEENKKARLDMTTSYPLADSGRQYYLATTYQGPSGLVQFSDLIPVKFADPTSVNEIQATDDFSISFDRTSSCVAINAPSEIKIINVYDLRGQKVECDLSIFGKRAMLKLNNNDILIISIADNEGNTKTFKLR